MNQAIGVSVSIVSYFHDLPTLTATLDSLTAALGKLAESMPVRAGIVIVDNSEAGRDASRLRDWLAQREQARAAGASATNTRVQVRLQESGANTGYGAGNNLGQAANNSLMAGIAPEQRWVLILNPDVVLAEQALLAGISSLIARPGCSMLCPRAVGDDGQDLYLAHRYPGWRVLGLRAVTPHVVTAGKPAWASALMRRYECRDLPQDQAHLETVCASGCFMLMPYRSWQQAGGFDERFFLYFEDYDLSCRLLAIGPVLYEPSVGISHAGGKAAGKSSQHRRWFATSALRFFWLNGWPRRRQRINSAEPSPARVRAS